MHTEDSSAVPQRRQSFTASVHRQLRQGLAVLMAQQACLRVRVIDQSGAVAHLFDLETVFFEMPSKAYATQWCSPRPCEALPFRWLFYMIMCDSPFFAAVKF